MMTCSEYDRSSTSTITTIWSSIGDIFFTSSRCTSISSITRPYCYLCVIIKFHSYCVAVKNYNRSIAIMHTFASKISIIAISDNHKDYSLPVIEFQKRLATHVEVTLLKPIRWDTHAQIIAKETDLIITALKKYPNYTKILLAKGWKQYTSETFASTIQSGQRCFIIWWPYGVDEAILASHIDKYISFGAHTLPHGLALLVLLEQLWRAKCICEWRNYHY